MERANDLADKDTLGKQDPYVILECGRHKEKSKTHKGGGAHPVWNEKFHFKVDQENEVILTIMDDDLLKDDTIGTCWIPLGQVKQLGQQTLQVPVNMKKGAQKGSVIVHMTYIRPGPAVHSC